MLLKEEEENTSVVENELAKMTQAGSLDSLGDVVSTATNTTTGNEDNEHVISSPNTLVLNEITYEPSCSTKESMLLLEEKTSEDDDNNNTTLPKNIGIEYNVNEKPSSSFMISKTDVNLVQEAEEKQQEEEDENEEAEEEEEDDDDDDDDDEDNQSSSTKNGEDDDNGNKDLWTLEEDLILLEMQAEVGNKWSRIARELKNRTENQAKTRFKSIMRAKAREWTEEEDKLLLELRRQERTSWDAVACQFEKRTRHALKVRFSYLLNSQLGLKEPIKLGDPRQALQKIKNHPSFPPIVEARKNVKRVFVQTGASASKAKPANKRTRESKVSIVPSLPSSSSQSSASNPAASRMVNFRNMIAASPVSVASHNNNNNNNNKVARKGLQQKNHDVFHHHHQQPMQNFVQPSPMRGGPSGAGVYMPATMNTQYMQFNSPVQVPPPPHLQNMFMGYHTQLQHQSPMIPMMSSPNSFQSNFYHPNNGQQQQSLGMFHVDPRIIQQQQQQRHPIPMQMMCMPPQQTPVAHPKFFPIPGRLINQHQFPQANFASHLGAMPVAPR